MVGRRRKFSGLHAPPGVAGPGFLFWFIGLLAYRNLILTISAQMQTSVQFKFALYITND